MNPVIDRPRIVAEPSRVPGAGAVLTPDALDLVAELHERFDSRRRELLDKRLDRQKSFDAGELPDFRDDTRDIRESEWTVGGIPADLLDRRVEITGPTNAKMVINALNSGAKVFMADFEDATSPTGTSSSPARRTSRPTGSGACISGIRTTTSIMTWVRLRRC